MPKRKRSGSTRQSYAKNKKAAIRIANSLKQRGYPVVSIERGKKYKYEIRTKGRAKKGGKSTIIDFTR